MPRKLILDIEEDFSFELIGLSCNLKDYRFVFYLNKALEYEFERLPILNFKYKNQSSKHSVYRYFDEENMNDFICLTNKYQSNYISPEYKHLDFLIMIDNNAGDEFLNNIIKKLRKDKHIRMVNKLDTNIIKSYNALCHEVELHLNK